MDFKNIITNEQALRKIIPSYPVIMDKRIKPQLDDYSLEFIHLASVAVLGFSDHQLGIHYLDLKNNHFQIASNNRLTMAIPNIELSIFPFKSYCSLYFLIPGVGHGLRVNGHTVKTNDKDASGAQQLSIYIDEVYVHCSRAIVRSSLWNSTQLKMNKKHLQTMNAFEGTNRSLNSNIQTFIESSPFIFLKTQNEKGQCEISPRGDPEQIVNIIDNNTLLIAERAGNKVAKSMRNILLNPSICLSFVIPQVNNTLTITGKAKLTSNIKLLEPLTINKKTPKVGIIISIQSIKFMNQQDGLTNSGIWNNENYINEKSLTKFSKVLSHHMNGTGLLGKATTPVINAIVRHDLKNLY